MKTNVKPAQLKTHEGGVAKHINPELQLRRSVMSCMLWEGEFYESGESIAKRIAETIPKVDPEKVAQIAIEAREQMKLRHVPLLIVREMARLPEHKKFVAETLYRIIQRADELAEFVSIYWKDGKQPLSAQVKKGLAKAFTKFNEYALAKYNRDGAVKLRDVLFLCHAAPTGIEQAELWKRLIDGTLATPDTWEVSLSDSNDKRSKKEKWETLLKENKLGALALLRNLRNFGQESVDDDLVIKALKEVKVQRVLPFRFIAAARYAPHFEPYIEEAMLKCLESNEKMYGHTVILIDVSCSMDAKISGKSDITRLDAACGVAMLLREICDRIDIYSFSTKLKQIPARRGFALRDAIVNSQTHGGTPLGEAIKCIYAPKSYKLGVQSMGCGNSYGEGYVGQELRPDRLIVITDEQGTGTTPNPTGKGYMINVASSRNGVGYGPWAHVDGWSEAVVNYIQAFESFSVEEQ